MAGYKGHIYFGIFFTAIVVLVSYYLGIITGSIVEMIIVIPILFVYTLLPDIDIASSKIRGIVTKIGLSFLLLTLIIDIRILALSITLILFFMQFLKHRKFTHTIAAGALFSAPLIFYNDIVAALAFAGYLSHLFLDGKLKFI